MAKLVNNFENRSIFGDDTDKSLRPTFWATLYITCRDYFPDITRKEWDDKCRLEAANFQLTSSQNASQFASY